jgi:hypothetical protein
VNRGTKSVQRDGERNRNGEREKRKGISTGIVTGKETGTGKGKKGKERVAGRYIRVTFT